MISNLSVALVVSVLVFTGFFATANRLSVRVLRGVHAYVLPETGENTESGKGKRKPQPSGKQKKGKKDYKDFGEEFGAQILRLDLAGSQIENRRYFHEYDETVTYVVVGLTNIGTRELLALVSSGLRENFPEWAKALQPDDRISFFVGVFTAFKLLRLLSRVGHDLQLGRSSERWLKWVVGFVGCILAYILLLAVPISYLDFGIDEGVVEAEKVAMLFMEKKGIESKITFPLSPGLVKVVLSLSAGIISGSLYGPALRNMKNYWLGTDYLLWNISVLKRGILVRDILNASLVLPLVVGFLWYKPIAQMFVLPGQGVTCGEEGSLGEVDHRCIGADRFSAVGVWSKLCSAFSVLGLIGRGILTRDYEWTEEVGVSEESFSQIRMWVVSAVGFLLICLFRVNIQSYCNGAVLAWYRGLHPDGRSVKAEVIKARIFLNNYLVCRAAVEALVPGALLVHLLGIARARGFHLDAAAREGTFFIAPSLVRSLFSFLLWWTISSWALQSCILYVLFRLRFLSYTS